MNSEEGDAQRTEDEGRQHIGHPEFGLEGQIAAHAEDHHVAQEGQVGDDGGAEDGCQQTCADGDAALQDGHGNGREQRALAVGGGVNDEDDEVQNGLGEQGGGISGQTVLNGTHDGHGADADGERGGNETLDKLAVITPGGLFLEPCAELFQLAVKVQHLAREGAQSHGQDHQQSLLDGQIGEGAVFHEEHVLQCTRRTDEDGGQTHDAHDGLLIAGVHTAAQEQADGAAAQNGKNIYNGSQSKHSVSLPYVKE